MTARRLNRGGRIDRSRVLHGSFDGKPMLGFAGDTLASALLASGHRIVARSFKYHRPRGVMAAGVEEANALVHLRNGARLEPNSQATTIEMFDGLTATPQNTWPSLRFDVGAINGVLSRFLGAGFYYKTFIGPFRGTRYWMTCERFIRKAAGMGAAHAINDPDSYEKLNAFCDVLVIGAGPAGLAAAAAASCKGQRVILVDQDHALGGALLSEPTTGKEAEWLSRIEAELSGRETVTVLTRTTAFGVYDGGVVGLVERVSDHLQVPETGQPRQRYWLVRATRIVLATGAIERPLVFADNDRPGVMLASAARRYLNRHAILVGDHILVTTNNNSAYPTAIDLAGAGAKVVLCDMRASPPQEMLQRARSAGINVRTGHGVLRANGTNGVKSARIVPIGEDGRAVGSGEVLPCDVIACSGGWSPALHLWSHRFGKPDYDPDLDAFVPGRNDDGLSCIGGLIGAESFNHCIGQGLNAGGGDGTPPEACDVQDFWGRELLPVTTIALADGSIPGKAFVDLQHDVKLADIDQAHREGYVSVEHLKRYTTNGMAADQGKTSNINALARLAKLRGVPTPAAGTTTFRPPYTPVTIGALVGHEFGSHFRPTRLSPMHSWHVQQGASLIEVGPWLRPWYYPRSGEDLALASVREAGNVRENVGIVDVSTLGKIAVQGPDAAEFLNRVYVNGFATLEVGRIRYGVMLREDGIVLDDGTTARVGEHDYFMTTTTTNAAKVLANFEHLLQTAWRDLRVHVTTVTDQWATIAVAGPRSRDLLTTVTRSDLSKEILPNNRFVNVVIAGVPCRLHRMSYSGELAYEVYIPANSGETVWMALVLAGKTYDLSPYGTEAMSTLRIEKGHIAGPELDGRTALRDLGLAGLASKKKSFIGSVLRRRPVLEAEDRPVLVGLKVAGPVGAKAGSLLFGTGTATAGHGEGWVSSPTWSPALGSHIALAFLARGEERHGEKVQIVNFVGNENLCGEVVSPRFFDPEGTRQNG